MPEDLLSPVETEVQEGTIAALSPDMGTLPNLFPNLAKRLAIKQQQAARERAKKDKPKPWQTTVLGKI